MEAIDSVERTIQGLINYVKTFPGREWEDGIAICYDAETKSKEFAKKAASLLAAEGVRAHLAHEFRPAPFASFACRYLKCIAALYFTSSQIKQKYNSCIIYWSDGGQVVQPHDQGISKEIEKIEILPEMEKLPRDHPLIFKMSKDVDESYLKEIQNLRTFPHRDVEESKKLEILYASDQSTGITTILQALKSWSLSNIHLIKNRTLPEQLCDLKAAHDDILLFTGPDGDRLTCTILHRNEPLTFSGNELGILLLHYLIDHKKPEGRWATITTIASTLLIRKITENHGGHCFELLPDFKYIAEKIHHWEAKKRSGYQFLFGLDNSSGYLYGTYTRDKDAAITACLTAEMALHLKRYGKTLLDYLYEIYDAYGIHRSTERLISYPEDSEKISQIMPKLRSHLPHKLAGIRVLAIEDYLSSIVTTLHNKKETKLDLPKSDLLRFQLEDLSIIVISPANNAPQIKIYAEISGKGYASIPTGITTLDRKLSAMLDEIEAKLLR